MKKGKVEPPKSKAKVDEKTVNSMKAKMEEKLANSMKAKVESMAKLTPVKSEKEIEIVKPLAPLPPDEPKAP